MKLVNKETGENVSVSEAGGKVLLETGAYELPAKPKPSKKTAAAEAATDED